MRGVITISLTVAGLYILQSLPAYRLTDLAIPIKVIRLQADIACIFCIYLGVREHSLLRGAILAFIVGLFANTFSPSGLRVFSFLAPVCFVVTYIANVCFYFRRLETYILLVFTVSFFYNQAFFYLMHTVADWNVSFTQVWWPSALQAVMNAFFGAIIFTFFDWIKETEHAA